MQEALGFMAKLNRETNDEKNADKLGQIFHEKNISAVELITLLKQVSTYDYF